MAQAVKMVKILLVIKKILWGMKK